MSAKTWAAQPWAASMYFIIYHYLSHQLAYRAAMKLFHPCLSFASLWMVPQVWFIFFISASTILHQVVFGQPRFRFPSSELQLWWWSLHLCAARFGQTVGLKPWGWFFWWWCDSLILVDSGEGAHWRQRSCDIMQRMSCDTWYHSTSDPADLIVAHGILQQSLWLKVFV